MSTSPSGPPVNPFPSAPQIPTAAMRFKATLVTNWKTTVSSLLTITLTTTAVLLPMGVLNAKQTTAALVVQALAKAYLGLIQSDAH